VRVVTLSPEGVAFAVPVEVRFRWPDTAPDDGLVDGLGVDEGTLRLYRNGVGITGQCRNAGYQPGTCVTRCCDQVANTWTVQVSAFSEYALDVQSCAPYQTAKLTLGKILAPAGDDTLAFSGALAAPAPPPDPDAHGVTIALEDAGGLVTEQTLPRAASTRVSRPVGRSTSGARSGPGCTRRTGGLGGFVKAVVVSKKGRLVLALKGQTGSYAVLKPVAIAVTFPADGACARADFGTSGHRCVVKKKGKTLACN